MSATHTYTFEEDMYRALSFARSRQERDPSRASALVVTKLEEAVFWNDVERVRRGLDPLGLEWRP